MSTHSVNGMQIATLRSARLVTFLYLDHRVHLSVVAEQDGSQKGPFAGDYSH